MGWAAFSPDESIADGGFSRRTQSNWLHLASMNESIELLAWNKEMMRQGRDLIHTTHSQTITKLSDTCYSGIHTNTSAVISLVIVSWMSNNGLMRVPNSSYGEKKIIRILYFGRRYLVERYGQYLQLWQ